MNGRIQSLLKCFRRAEIDAFWVSSVANVTYLSGFTGEESFLFVSPKKTFLVTDSRYAEQAQREVAQIDVVLRGGRSLAEILKDLAASQGVYRIGFESASVSYAFYRELTSQVDAERLKPLTALVEELRVKKDTSEIQKIRKSAKIAVDGFRYIKEVATPGMTEKELQGRLEYYTKTKGSEKPAFDLIIASGARSSMPHCKTGDFKVQNNAVLLVDMGTVYQGYHSDLTRPVFLGKMPNLHRKIRDIVRDAQLAGIRKVAPGVAARDVDAASRSFIEKKGYGRYFGHGTGHGVGLEVHEAPTISPRSRAILRPGMVITIEPGIYLPGRFGIRIEDMVLVTARGHEVLTAGLDD